MVSDYLYFLLISKKCKHGLHILEMQTLRTRHSRKFTSSQGVNLVKGNSTFSLSPKDYLVSYIMSLDSMKGLLIVLDIFYSSCASCNLTFGYCRTEIYMNIFLQMSMT